MDDCTVLRRLLPGLISWRDFLGTACSASYTRLQCPASPPSSRSSHSPSSSSWLRSSHPALHSLSAITTSPTNVHGSAFPTSATCLQPRLHHLRCMGSLVPAATDASGISEPLFRPSRALVLHRR